jgi:hypothetical protein
LIIAGGYFQVDRLVASTMVRPFTPLIYNERVKLLANALDRASTAVLTVGALTPIAAALFRTLPEASIWELYALFSLWIVAGYILHLRAQATLGRLLS